MLLKIWKDKPEISQEQIDRLSNIVEKWQKVDALTRTPGWQILVADQEKVLEHKKDIRNSSNQSEEYRKGYCDGLSHQSSLIKSYKRAAERAGEKLNRLAQEMKG